MAIVVAKRREQVVLARLGARAWQRMELGWEEGGQVGPWLGQGNEKEKPV